MNIGDIIGYTIGWSFVAFIVWAMITTIVHIHKNIGISTNCGFYWFLAVIVGNLFGVILYRFCRERIENVMESLFERL